MNLYWLLEKSVGFRQFFGPFRWLLDILAPCKGWRASGVHFIHFIHFTSLYIAHRQTNQ